jgi:hypothetical protein
MNRACSFATLVGILLAHPTARLIHADILKAR